MSGMFYSVVANRRQSNLYIIGCERGGFRPPVLGNRSFFHPDSEVGNTFAFDVVEDTDSNLTSNVFYIETLSRAVPKDTSPWFPRY